MPRNKKQTWWKRILTAVLAVFFCVASVPVFSFAEPESEEEAENDTASWRELTDRREIASRTFLSGSGDEVTALYPYPIFYQEEGTGELIPYDYRLELVSGEDDVKEYRVRDGSMDTSVRRFFSGGEFMKIGCGKNGGTMELSLPVTDRGRTMLPEFKVQAGLYGEGSVSRNQVSEDKVAAEHFRNYGICKEALTGIDVAVEQWPGNVEISAEFQKLSRAKEGLVLSAAFEGLTFEEKVDGSLHIYDGGTDVVVLESPVVYDGKKAVGRASYMLSPREDGATQILVMPDTAWMEGQSRIGPVTLLVHITQRGMEEGISTSIQSTEGYFNDVPIAAGNTRETVQTEISLPELPVRSEGNTLEQVNLVFSRTEDTAEAIGSMELGVYMQLGEGKTADTPMDSVRYEPEEKPSICMMDITEAYEGGSSGGVIVLKSVETELVTGIYGFDFFVSDMLLPMLLVNSERPAEVEAGETGGDIRIVGEDTEKRDRFTKHFLMEDGTYLAAVYEVPVHYRSDGRWEEIDNTLVYDETEALYENRASDIKLAFAVDSAAESLVSMQAGVDTCSWGFLEGEVNDEGQGSLFVPEEGIGEKDFAGEERYLELSRDTEGKSVSAGNADQMKVSGITSGGTYEKVLKNVDIRYVLDSAELRESIIFRTKEAAETPIRFLVRHPGLEMSLTEEGNVIFTRAGETVFTVEAPYMYDWAGDTSGNVSFSLEKESSGATVLTVEPDREWLAERKRTYPVAVERITESKTAGKAVQTAFVREKQPEEAAESAVPLPVGYLSGYGVSRTFLKFPELPVLEPGEKITKGILNLYQDQYVSSRSADFVTAAYCVIEDWDASASWETQPGFGETVFDSQKVEAVKTSEEGSMLVLKQFDVTSLVDSWYGEQNFGLMLGSDRENTRVGAGYTVSNRSLRSEPYPPYLYPTGLFYYQKGEGSSEGRKTYEQNGSWAGNGYVEGFGGTLTFVHGDMDAVEGRLPDGLNHVYSSEWLTEKSVYGNGWSLDAVEKLKVTGLSGLPYLYIDGNGTEHFFRPDEEDNAAMRDVNDPGIRLAERGYGQWILSGKDGNERIFGPDGLLLQKRNADGTEIYYNYGDGGKLLGLSDSGGVLVSFTYGADDRLLSSTDEITGRTLNYQYDLVGNLTGILHTNGKMSTYSYEEGRLIRAKDADGTAVEYLYGTDTGTMRVIMTRVWKAGTAETETFSY